MTEKIELKVIKENGCSNLTDVFTREVVRSIVLDDGICYRLAQNAQEAKMTSEPTLVIDKLLHDEMSKDPRPHLRAQVFNAYGGKLDDGETIDLIYLQSAVLKSSNVTFTGTKSEDVPPPQNGAIIALCLKN